MSPDQIIGFCLGLNIIQSSFIYFKFISLWYSRLQPRIYGLHWNRPTWISCKYTEKEPKVIAWFDGRGKGSAECPRSQVASPNFPIIIRIWDAHFPYTPTTIFLQSSFISVDGFRIILYIEISAFRRVEKILWEEWRQRNIELKNTIKKYRRKKNWFVTKLNHTCLQIPINNQMEYKLRLV